MFLNPPVDTVRLSTSWLLRPPVLASIRTLISVYIFSALIAILAYNSIHNHRQVARHWSYFTYITNWSLAFYFAFAALHSWTYWLSSSGQPALARWPRVLQQLHSIFYTTIAVYPFIVTLVFWALIFNHFRQTFDTWSNISVHALNSAFALFEVVFTRADPLPWIHLLYLILMLAMYVGVAYITVATEHFYVYAFLDSSRSGGRGRVAGYIFGILAVAIVVFAVVRYVIWLRRWSTERKGVNPKVLAHRGPRGGHGGDMAEFHSNGRRKY